MTTTFHVAASAEKNVKPTYGEVRVTIRSEEKVAQESYDKVALENNDFANKWRDESIVTQFSTLNSMRSYTTQVLVDNEFELRYVTAVEYLLQFEDFSKLGEFISTIAGNDLYSFLIQWKLSKDVRNSAEAELRKEVMQNALRTARDYARGAGFEAEKLQLVSMSDKPYSSFAPSLTRGKMGVAAAGVNFSNEQTIPEIEPNDIRVTSSVEAVYSANY